jgi:hypothetical protein
MQLIFEGSDDTKLPPPPRNAQNRSGLSVALARRLFPSAVIKSAEIRLSQAKPNFRDRLPYPPPNGERCGAFNVSRGKTEAPQRA